MGMTLRSGRPKEPDAVLDERTLAHPEGERREDGGAEEGRRDALEIRGVGEERERVVETGRHPLLAFEEPRLHGGFDASRASASARIRWARTADRPGLP
jgi:hypothetical protein